jgi:hypothetical protein
VVALIEQMAQGQKNDPPLSPSSPYLHGAGGLFNRRELENPVVSAIMGPMPGVANAIPVFNGSRNLDGQWGGEDNGYDTILTGVTSGAADTFSNQPTTDCAVGPVGGLLKMCTLVNTYGHYKASTREVSQFQAGRVADRVDARLISLVNAMQPGLFATPSPTPSLANALNNELAARIWESVLSFQRMFCPRVFSGSPANNSGSRRDIVGLDLHINQNNKVDATSSAVCTAANSDIKPFNFDQVRGNGRNVVQYIEMADKYVQWNARKQGFGSVDGFIAVRPELWWEISEVIPVQKYERVLALVNRVTNERGMVDARQVYDERDAIRQTHMIPVNGRMLQVVEDDCIAELNVTTASQLIAGQYASDIYFVPTTVLGGSFPVTFWEYFDYANTQGRTIQQWTGNTLTFSTDGGMFLWHVDYARGCIQLTFEIAPRLRVRTPQLAWRITNVGYEPLQHLRDWNPSSSYFADGGNTGSPDITKLYSEWSVSTPVAP